MLHHRKHLVAPSRSRTSGPDPFDVYVLRDQSTKIEGETSMTTGQIKGVFAGTVQARYGLKRSDALNAISSVIPYIPVRKKKIGNEWVAAKVDNDRDTMANVFSQHHTGLFLIQLSEEFKSTHDDNQAREIQTLREKETSWAVLQKDLLNRMTKMEETFKVNVERSKADLEALKAKVERSKAELEEALKAEAKRSKVELEEALRAEVKRSKEVEERLKADLNAERKRVQLKEENSAKASAVFKDNMAEVKSFIANGRREDTAAFY